MTKDFDQMEPAMSWKVSRRNVLQTMAAWSAAHTVTLDASCDVGLDPSHTEPLATAISPEGLPSMTEVQLGVNGRNYLLKIDNRVTVLDALREHLDLKGTKKACDHGQCGACTVLIDGRRTNACLTLAIMHDGHAITTIEGLSHGDELHPMQAAFLKHDGFQCGYCTPGQICSAVGMLAEARSGAPSHVTRDDSFAPGSLSDEEIRERMSGNLCRCSAYPNIVAAIREIASAQS